MNKKMVGVKTPSRGMPPPSTKTPMTCWTYLTIALLSVSAAFALLVCMNNVLLYQNGAESILHRCQTFKDTEILSFLNGNYPCHYLRLWGEMLHKSTDEALCFIRTFIVAAILLSSHFVLATMILLFVGIIKGKYLAFLPWLMVSIVIVIVLVFLVLAEVVIKQDGSFFVTSAAWPIIAILGFLDLTWLAAMVTCLQIKKNNEIQEMTNNFDYFKF